MKKILYIYLFSIAALGSGCDDLLEFGPTDDGVVLAENALETPEDLQRLLNSCYDVFANTYDGDVQFINELLGDNLNGVNPNNLTLTDIYNREAGDFNGLTNGVYNDFYYSIFRSNAILENFDLVSGLSDAERLRMEAEAKFIRAVSHWELVKLYGQPFGYTSDNSHLGVILRTEPSQESRSRSTVEEVYNLVLEDLLFAEQYLPASNDVYATSYAANSYLAKIYFLMGNYQAAAAEASLAMSGPFQLDTLLGRYDQFAISDETIFGFVSKVLEAGPNPVADNRVGAFISAYSGNTPNAAFDGAAFNSMFIGSSDLRVGTYYTAPTEVLGNAKVAKFNAQFFNHAVTSVTEMMLIMAESNAELGSGLDQSIDYINAIRERAFENSAFNLDDNASAAAIIAASRLERRIEFVGEGKRLDDLKRQGVKGENILVRGAPWDCNGMVVQFPLGENVVPNFQDNPVGGCN
tara:strand:- start:1374 stop:2768 length:1395 start_codon:yes stop_codon:yes gene_type:complete